MIDPNRPIAGAPFAVVDCGAPTLRRIGQGGALPFFGATMNPKHEPGDYLDLRWDYGDPEEVYVYGHVDTPSFLASVASHLSGSVESLDFGTFPVLVGEVRHRWARFVLAGSSLEGTCRELREYREAGPGRFKVSAMTPDKWIRFPRCARTIMGEDGEASCWIREGHSGPCVPWSPQCAGLVRVSPDGAPHACVPR